MDTSAALKYITCLWEVSITERSNRLNACAITSRSRCTPFKTRSTPLNYGDYYGGYGIGNRIGYGLKDVTGDVLGIGIPLGIGG